MKYHETYKKYFNWNKGFIEAGLNKNYLTTIYGWQRHIKDLFQFKDGKKIDIRRSLLNWPIQSHGAEILRKALIDLTDENFEVCALVHDAVLIQIPIPEFSQRLEEAKDIMQKASFEVVGGVIKVDHEIIKTNYKQLDDNGEPNDDQKLYDDIMNEINTYTRTGPNVHPH